MPLEISVRDVMVPVAIGQSFFDALRTLGLSSVEIYIDSNGNAPMLVEADGRSPFSIGGEQAVEQLHHRLNAEGITAAALLLATDYSGPEALKHVECSIKAVRAAEALGAPVVRIDTATAAKVSMQELQENFLRVMEQVLLETEKTAIGLGIENHGTVSNNLDFLNDVFARIPNPRLGMTLDPANFYWYGFPLEKVYSVIDHFASRALHTHLKNINYPADIVETTREIGYQYEEYCCPLGEGNISMERVVEILLGAGYDRTLCIENEALSKYPEQERVQIVKNDAAVLRAVQS